MAYTAQQLVTLVCQICKVPGRLTQVGQMMNLILANHAQTIDEDVIRVTLPNFVIGPQATIPYPYPLPANYLRMYDIFYLVDGEPFYLDQMELCDLDKQYTGSGIDNYPERYATDIATAAGGVVGAAFPIIYFYPPPAIPLSLTLRYRPQTPDIASPETSALVPWFPSQLVLVEEMCEKAMWLSDDSRSETFRKNVQEDIKKYLALSDDKEGFSQRVKLDPNTFRPRSNFPPSKKTGF